MEGYNIRRSLKVNGGLLSVFFKDNESPPLFSLQDSLKIIFNDYSRNTTMYAQKIPTEHKDKISLGHTELWTIDLEGFCILAREQLEEPDMIGILKEINRFVAHEQDALPSPVKTIEYTNPDKVFKKISFREQKISYLIENNKVLFRLEDFKQIYGISRVEGAIKSIDLADIKYYKTELGNNSWITTDGLMDLLYNMGIETPLQDYEKILTLLSEEEQISGVWNCDLNYPSMLIGGDKTDPSRYQKFMLDSIECVAYNIEDKVLIFYNIEDICKVQGLNKEKGKRAAIHHITLMFFSEENKIFVTIFGVNEVMKHLRYTNHKFITELAKRSSDIAEKMTWNLKGETFRVLRHELEIRENDTMTPVKVQGLNLVVLKAAELEVEDGKRCWILQAKISNLQGETMPLFVVKSLEDVLGFTRGRTKVNVVPKEDLCRVTIKNFRKHNVYTVTRSGLRVLAKSVGADPSMVEKIEKTADAWIEETKEDIKFAVQMELTKKEEQAKDITNTAIVEEIKDAIEFSFMYKDVEIKGAVQVIDDVMMVYYDKESLSQITTIAATPIAYLDNKVYIPINHLAEAVGKQFFSDIFTASKKEYEKVVEKIIKGKESEQPRDMMYNYLGSQNTEVFILGAVMLAERLRNVIVWLRVNQKKRRGFAGPSSNDLLNELWKHIDCQDHKVPISFGFRKLVTAVTSRYEALRDIIRATRHNAQ